MNCNGGFEVGDASGLCVSALPVGRRFLNGWGGEVWRAVGL